MNKIIPILTILVVFSFFAFLATPIGSALWVLFLDAYLLFIIVGGIISIINIELNRKKVKKNYSFQEALKISPFSEDDIRDAKLRLNMFYMISNIKHPKDVNKYNYGIDKGYFKGINRNILYQMGEDVTDIQLLTYSEEDMKYYQTLTWLYYYKKYGMISDAEIDKAIEIERLKVIEFQKKQDISGDFIVYELKEEGEFKMKYKKPYSEVISFIMFTGHEKGKIIN